MIDEEENLFKHWHPLRKIRKEISHDTYQLQKGVHKELQTLHKKITLKGFLHDIDRFDPAVIAARGILLLMLEKNVFGVAPDFAKEAEENTVHWQRIAGMWETLGGKADKLKEAAERGSLRRKFLFDGGDEYIPKELFYADERFNITASDKAMIAGSVTALGGTISALPLPTPGVAAPYAAIIAPTLAGMVALLPDTAPAKAVIPPLDNGGGKGGGADIPAGGNGGSNTASHIHNFIFSKKGALIIAGGLGIIGIVIYFIKYK